ncbi:MAG TPA: SpoIIE family protein phosphatase, partial [Acidimicrobiales bacterium]|nr:SpoIIE family protein phosphatase [Acidimicrobiales bacterium]
MVPEAIRNGSWQGETPFLSREGHLVSTSQVVLAHTSEDGTLQRLSTIARDLTYRDQAVAATEAYRQERYVAQTLQDALLPALPPLKDLEITARYRSAGHPAEVGGDWYDGFVLPDGDLAVVVGDVMGHDARAAATMGQLRSMVRALACDTGANPSYVLGRLDLLNECLGLTPFTTLVLAQVHTAPEG